jgi:chromosome segregation ATPase
MEIITTTAPQSSNPAVPVKRKSGVAEGKIQKFEVPSALDSKKHADEGTTTAPLKSDNEDEITPITSIRHQSIDIIEPVEPTTVSTFLEGSQATVGVDWHQVAAGVEEHKFGADLVEQSPRIHALLAEKDQTIANLTLECADTKQKLSLAMENRAKVARALKIRELQIQKHSIEVTGWTESNQDLSNKLIQQKEEYRLLGLEKSELEAKLEAFTAERENLRMIRDRSEGLHSLVAAKDEQINSILEDNEKLSKKSAIAEQSLRSVRAESKEYAREVEKLKAQLVAQEAQYRSLEERFFDSQKSHRSKAETIEQQNQQFSKFQKELLARDQSLSHAEAKSQEINLLLAQSLAEIQQKEKLILELTTQLHAAEIGVKDSLREVDVLRKEAFGMRLREEALLKNIADLQGLVTLSSQGTSSRERELEAEIDDLRRKYQQVQLQNEDMVSAVPEATRPLLRQIRSLQHSQAAQTESWQALESSFREQLKDTRLELAKMRVERSSFEEAKAELDMRLSERTLQVTELKERMLKQSAEHKHLHDERERLRGELQMQTQEAKRLEAWVKQHEAQMKTLAQRFDESSLVHSHEHQSVQQQLELEQRARSALEKRVEELTRAGAALEQCEDRIYAEPDSLMSSAMSFGQDKVAMTSTVEMLRSFLKQKEGEIAALQLRVRESDLLKDNLASVLGKHKKSLGEAENMRIVAKQLQTKLQQLTVRHELGLQMIAEKEQEIEDLKEEMENMKKIFQTQVQTLTASPSSLT